MSQTYYSTEPDEETLYQCRHILTDGRRCGSPSLRKEHFCYYHHKIRRPVPIRELEARRGMQGVFELPNPEDRSAIQHAIGQVLQRIAANELDPRRAGLLLYGLQIASLNLLKNDQKVIPEAYVEAVEVDPEFGELAPQTEFTENHGRKGSVAKLLEKLKNERDQRQREAAVLPKVQAVAAEPNPYTFLTPLAGKLCNGRSHLARRRTCRCSLSLQESRSPHPRSAPSASAPSPAFRSSAWTLSARRRTARRRRLRC